MQIKIKKECPQGVKDLLKEWEEKGWLTINLATDNVEEDDSFVPLNQISKEEPLKEPIELIWCKRLKAIARKISKLLNNQLINTHARGIPGNYTFLFDSNGFCKMIDELYRNHHNYITAYLHETKKPIGVTFIFPFLGEILKSQIFNKKELQKRDLKEVFKLFKYNSDTAVKKLSMHNKLYKNPDAKLLVEAAKMIGKKYANAE